VVKSPPHCPTANSICERVLGTVRRECLDWLIPLSESNLRSIHFLSCDLDTKRPQPHLFAQYSQARQVAVE